MDQSVIIFHLYREQTEKAYWYPLSLPMKDNSKMDIHMASDTTIQDTYNLLDNSKMDNLVGNV